MLERQKENLKSLKDKSASKIEEIFVQTLYIIIFVLYNLFEIYLIYLMGKYSNKVIELLLIILCFLVNKSIYGKPLHFRNNFKCLGVSLILFYVATQCALNLDLSIMANVVIGVFCGSITSYIATYLYRENKKYDELKKCTIEEFTDYCQHRNLTEDEIKIANCIIREEIKGEALYLKISYSKSQTLRIKKRIFSKLDL
jgi:hypothetical protein